MLPAIADHREDKWYPLAVAIPFLWGALSRWGRLAERETTVVDFALFAFGLQRICELSDPPQRYFIEGKALRSHQTSIECRGR